MNLTIAQERKQKRRKDVAASYNNVNISGIVRGLSLKYGVSEVTIWNDIKVLGLREPIGDPGDIEPA